MIILSLFIHLLLQHNYIYLHILKVFLGRKKVLVADFCVFALLWSFLFRSRHDVNKWKKENEGDNDGTDEDSNT